MSERFKLDWSKRVGIHFVLDTNTGERIDFYSDVVDLLNEQQATICKLQEENKQLKLTLSEYGVDLKAFEIFKQKIGYYGKVIDDE